MAGLNSEQTTFLETFLNTNNFTTQKLAGDVSVREYFRINSQEKSYVLMQAEPQSLHSFLDTAQFFQELTISVPHIFKVSENLGLILMEDGGDLLLESLANKSLEKALPYYKKAISELVILQTKGSNSKKTCQARTIKFSSEKFLKELFFTEENLFQKYLNLDYNQNELRQEFKTLSKNISDIPYCLTHRDFHSRNILVNQGTIIILDFQDARLGPYQYDVCSLLRDAYVLFSEQSQNELLDYYFECHKKENSSLKKDSFLQYYDDVSLQRSLKACGTFAGVWNRTKDDFYLKYLSTSLTYIRKILENKKAEFPEVFNIIGEIKT